MRRVVGPAQDARVHDLPGVTDAKTFRLRVAGLMAVVALVSAYVTFVATDRGSAAAALEGTAAQQSAEEQQVEQQIDAIVSQERRLTARVDEYLQTYRQRSADALDVRQSDPIRAAALDLQAQAEVEGLRHLLPFYRGAAPDLTAAEATYPVDDAKDALRMQGRLFRVSGAATRVEAAALRATATSLVLVVVLLVASLFLLTLAHLAGGRRGVALAVAGIVAAAAAVIWFAVIARGAILPLGIGAIAAAAVAVIVWRFGRERGWLGGLEEAEASDIAVVPTRPDPLPVVDPEAPPTTRSTRYVALAIAFVTLFGAWVGFLQGTASDRASESAWEAQDLGVQAIGALRAAEEDAAVAIDIYELALTQRVASWSATEAAAYADSISDTVEASRQRTEAARLAALATSTETRSDATASLGSAGVSSEFALRRFRAAVSEPSARLAALQDAANVAARDWGDRAAIHLSVLAWLAVAVYLLGLSLVFRERRVRNVLVVVGTVMILAGVARAATVWTLPDVATADQAQRAADAYAAGVVALERNEPVAAQAAFTEAIRWRPAFTLARRERAEATLLSGSAKGVGVRSVFTAESVRLAIEDLTAARDGGLETAGVVLNLGAMLFHRALLDGSAEDMQASIDLSRRGITLGKAFEDRYGRPHVNEVIGRSNLGLALLATGQTEEAATTYREMASATRRLPPQWQPAIATATLTALDLLATGTWAVPDVDRERVKAVILADVYGSPGDTPATLSGARAEVFSSILQWRATLHDLDPARDALVVQWYRYDAATDHWNGLPIVSGPVTLDRFTAGGQFHRDPGADTYWGNSNALVRDVPPTCVQPGRYRLEMYLNGRLAATQEADAAQTTYALDLARDVGYGLCRPEDWIPTGVVPGVSRGAAAPDGSRGVVVYRVYQPFGLTAPGGIDARSRALDRLVDQHPSGLPALSGAGITVDPTTQPTIFGLTGSVWRQYDYPMGVAKVSATWTAWAPSGIVLVTCIYGPADWVSSPEATAIALSLTEY